MWHGLGPAVGPLVRALASALQKKHCISECLQRKWDVPYLRFDLLFDL